MVSALRGKGGGVTRGQPGHCDQRWKMNIAQRQLVTYSLVVIGLVLAFVMLDWGYVHGHQRTRVLAFYSEGSLGALSANSVGIYTRHGVIGIIFGIIAPLCIWAVATYLIIAISKSRT